MTHRYEQPAHLASEKVVEAVRRASQRAQLPVAEEAAAAAAAGAQALDHDVAATPEVPWPRRLKALKGRC